MGRKLGPCEGHRGGVRAMRDGDRSVGNVRHLQRRDPVIAAVGGTPSDGEDEWAFGTFLRCRDLEEKHPSTTVPNREIEGPSLRGRPSSLEVSRCEP